VSMDDGNKAIVVVGQEDFPFPIPLIRKHGMWRFDAAAGRLELFYRRIGRNELDTIQVCFAYLDAQKEYAREGRTGAGRGIYARRILRQPRKKDGLYWPNLQGDGAARFGEMVSQATGDEYHAVHGYYHRVLTKQGPAAPDLVEFFGRLLTIYTISRKYASMKVDAKAMRVAADQASELLKALANRHRLLIICQLIDGERSVGELAGFLGIRDSTVSQHLALLRKDGLVSAARDGPTIWYSISSPPARELLET